MNNLKSKVDNFLLALLIFLSAVVFIVAFIEFYPVEVVRYDVPFKVLTPVVKQGGELQYVRQGEKYLDETARLACSFEDDIIYFIPDRVDRIPTGSIDGVRQITIPDNLPPATYVFKCTVTFKIHDFREVVHQFYTEKFEVVE